MEEDETEDGAISPSSVPSTSERLEIIAERHQQIQEMNREVSYELESKIEDLRGRYPGEENMIMKILNGEAARLLRIRDRRKKNG